MKVISVDKISKLYHLGGVSHNSVRDALAAVFNPGKRAPKRELWALRDVSFDVSDGDRLAIIGRNGAGKSTLLKILSRITKPTSGVAAIRGRVGSLLEVGTGFHAELTGRENIFLNGAILGMKRSEIESKFDEIVAFSEIEQFIDTPVKHFSSGMYMRLAFSVAAHLEPEILIVDEVLAVGDLAFQKKCLSKMRDVGENGRTVLFVSHDMSAVSRLCERTIWIKDGLVYRQGPTEDVVADYLQEQSQTGAERIWEDDSPGNEIVRLKRVRVTDDDGKSVSTADIRRPVHVEMEYDVLTSGCVLVPNFHFFNDRGDCLFISHDWFSGWRNQPREAGKYVSRCIVPGNFFAEGTLFVKVAVSTYEPFTVHFQEPDAVSFNVVDSLEGDSARGDYAGVLPGMIRPVLDWETEIRR